MLAREIVLGLTKLWDTADRAIRMDRVGDFIRTPAVIRAMAVERSLSIQKMGIPGAEDIMERELGERAQAALVIIDSYLPTGHHRTVHEGFTSSGTRGSHTVRSWRTPFSPSRRQRTRLKRSTTT